MSPVWAAPLGRVNYSSAQRSVPSQSPRPDDTAAGLGGAGVPSVPWRSPCSQATIRACLGWLAQPCRA